VCDGPGQINSVSDHFEEVRSPHTYTHRLKHAAPSTRRGMTIHTHTHTHTGTLTHMHTQAQAYRRTCTHAHTHIHTHRHRRDLYVPHAPMPDLLFMFHLLSLCPSLSVWFCSRIGDFGGLECGRGLFPRRVAADWRSATWPLHARRLDSALSTAAPSPSPLLLALTAVSRMVQVRSSLKQPVFFLSLLSFVVPVPVCVLRLKCPPSLCVLHACALLFDQSHQTHPHAPSSSERIAAIFGGLCLQFLGGRARDPRLSLSLSLSRARAHTHTHTHTHTHSQPSPRTHTRTHARTQHALARCVLPSWRPSAVRIT
jgi:hypothetical protein